MSFDPSRRVTVKVSDVDRARFWYEVGIYLKVLAIMSIPVALWIWAMCMWL